MFGEWVLDDPDGERIDWALFDWNNEYDLQWYPYSGSKVALELASHTNLLEKLNYVAYDDGQLYCDDSDSDCLVSYESGAWSDEEGNYFVAGYQKGKIDYSDLVYLINGKLYFPERNYVDNQRDEKILFDKIIGANSHRFFG